MPHFLRLTLAAGAAPIPVNMDAVSCIRPQDAGSRIVFTGAPEASIDVIEPLDLLGARMDADRA